MELPEIVPRDLLLIHRELHSRNLVPPRGHRIVIPQSMWDDASRDTQLLFHNSTRVQDIEYRVESFIGGAYWEPIPTPNK